MEVKMIPGPESNATELGFSWSLTSESEDELSIQIAFDKPTAVSTNPVSLHLLVTSTRYRISCMSNSTTYWHFWAKMGLKWKRPLL
jgi:hypothetical protein